MGKKKHHAKAPAPAAEAPAAPPPPPTPAEVAAAPAAEAAPAAPAAAPISPRTVEANVGVLRATKGCVDPILYPKQPKIPMAAEKYEPKPPEDCPDGKCTWKFGVCTNGCGTGRCGVCGKWGQKFCFKVGSGGIHCPKASWELLPNYPGTKHPRKTVAPWSHTGEANMSLPW